MYSVRQLKGVSRYSRSVNKAVVPQLVTFLAEHEVLSLECEKHKRYYYRDEESDTPVLIIDTARNAIMLNGKQGKMFSATKDYATMWLTPTVFIKLLNFGIGVKIHNHDFAVRRDYVIFESYSRLIATVPVADA